MQAQVRFTDSDVPFFPFPMRPAGNGGYLATNHHLDAPVRLNRQAAEVLRLADGETSLSGIVSRLTERYPEAGGADVVRVQTGLLLQQLTENELIWWRDVPLEPMPIGPPPSVFWEITAACNLRCRHCVVAAGVPSAGELSTARCLELAAELADFGVQNVAFSGGEPLIHPEFRVIAERVRELGMTFQVATNGTLVTPDLVRWLREMDAEVQVSLDGSTSAIHDDLRPGQDAFARTTEGIRTLAAGGLRVTVGAVLSTRNLEDIPAIVALVESLGAAAFRLIPFVPKGRGEYYADMEVSPAECKRITQYLHDLRGKVGIDISPIEFEGMLNGNGCREPVDWNRGLGCSGAVSYATITPTGELLPCHFFEGVRADSVASAPFEEVWRYSRFLNYFRHLTVADLHGVCRECAWLSQCGGSCRAVNFAKGDIFGANRGCWIAGELAEDVEHE